jgi:hypothetical protein
MIQTVSKYSVFLSAAAIAFNINPKLLLYFV